MRSAQNIVIIVYRECGWIPVGIRRMAHFAIGRNAERYVIRVDGLVEISRMATRTGIRCSGVIAVVTGITIIRYLYMCPRKWINVIVIKSRGYPGGL
jgi:precorrin-6x reductase